MRHRGGMPCPNLVTGALCGLALLGCRQEPETDEVHTRLTVGTTSEVTAPSPFVAGGLGATVLDLVFRPLLGGIDGSRAVGELAEGPTWSADGTELRLRLRDGVRFSNGTAVTAEDVADTLVRAKANGAWGTEELLTVQRTGPSTLTIAPSRPFLIPGALAAIGPAQKGSSPVVGAGPYVVTNVDADRLTLSANGRFDGAAPKLETLEFRRFSSPSEGWSNLLAGRVDLITFVPWNKFDQLTSIPSIRTQSTASSVLVEIRFRSPPPPFDQPSARLALALAIDRDELVSTALRGHGLPACGVVRPNSPSFDSNLEPYPFDPARAQRILQSLGCTRDEHGAMWWRGAPLRLEIDFAAGVPGFEALALVIQRQLAGAGIDVAFHGLGMAEVGATISGNQPYVMLRPRHATSDALSDEELRLLPPVPRPEIRSAEGAAEAAQAAQRRLRDLAPSIYLLWLNRLDVIDRRYCGLPSLPDGPEGHLDLVRPCAAGEDR